MCEERGLSSSPDETLRDIPFLIALAGVETRAVRNRGRGEQREIKTRARTFRGRMTDERRPRGAFSEVDRPTTLLADPRDSKFRHCPREKEGLLFSFRSDIFPAFYCGFLFFGFAPFRFIYISAPDSLDLINLIEFQQNQHVRAFLREKGRPRTGTMGEFERGFRAGSPSSTTFAVKLRAKSLRGRLPPLEAISCGSTFRIFQRPNSPRSRVTG